MIFKRQCQLLKTRRTELMAPFRCIQQNYTVTMWHAVHLMFPICHAIYLWRGILRLFCLPLPFYTVMCDAQNSSFYLGIKTSKKISFKVGWSTNFNPQIIESISQASLRRWCFFCESVIAEQHHRRTTFFAWYSRQLHVCGWDYGKPFLLHHHHQHECVHKKRGHLS